MRILWFTNTFLPGKEGATTTSLRHSGGWMLSLSNALKETHRDIQLSIATTRHVIDIERYVSGQIDCFAVPMQKDHSAKEEARALKICADIVNETAPDIVHIHGTERFFGLMSARGLISVPTVISLQGILVPYAEWNHYFGNRSSYEIFKMHRLIGLPLMRGAIWDYYRFNKAAKREREIIVGNHHFMGRTEWDRAHLHWINPSAQYYHVGEVLRRPFWDVRWSLSQCKRHRIIFTNAGHPRKGTELLLKAADYLKRDFADLEIFIVGELSTRSGYGRYVRREILRREEYVKEIGALNAKELAAELCNAHVFVSPSFIDNSPNAVCEAQLVGLPVISSFTGGLSSLIDNQHSGVFFPSGDVPYLASVIKRVFEDDKLAENLSKNGHATASQRHEQSTIVQDLLDCYTTVKNTNG